MRRTLTLLAALAAPTAFADCDYPSRVDVPNGSTADRDAMLEGQQAVKEYVTAMETYLECIVNEEKNLRSEMDELEPEDEQQREDMLNKKYNAAVEEMERVAANFNAELQAYREKSE